LYTPAAAGVAGEFPSAAGVLVARDPQDVVHEPRHIPENPVVDALEYVADGCACLVVKDGIGVVDVPGSTSLRGQEIPEQPERRADAGKVVFHFPFHSSPG
jgi:hypothetical protein